MHSYKKMHLQKWLSTKMSEICLCGTPTSFLIAHLPLHYTPSLDYIYSSKINQPKKPQLSKPSDKRKDPRSTAVSVHILDQSIRNHIKHHLVWLRNIITISESHYLCHFTKTVSNSVQFEVTWLKISIEFWSYMYSLTCSF